MYNSKYNYAETHYDMLGGPNPLSNYSFKYLMKNSVNCSLLINLDTLLIDYSFLTEMHNLFSDFYASYEHWHMSNISVLTPAGMENHLRGKHFLKNYSFFLSKLSRDSKYTLKIFVPKCFSLFGKQLSILASVRVLMEKLLKAISSEVFLKKLKLNVLRNHT